MDVPEVKAYLSALANARHVTVNSQKVALNALVYFYHKYFQRELGDMRFSLATRQQTLPIVLRAQEAAFNLKQLHEKARRR